MLQGVEAAALRAAIRTCRDKLVLLQHDGFTTCEQVSVSKIEAAVFEATGYRLKFEEQQLLYPFSKFAEELQGVDLKLQYNKKHIKNKDLHNEFRDSASTMAIHGGQGAPSSSSSLDWRHIIPVPPVYPDPIPETPDPFGLDSTYRSKGKGALLASRLSPKP